MYIMQLVWRFQFIAHQLSVQRHDLTTYRLHLNPSFKIKVPSHFVTNKHSQKRICVQSSKDAIKTIVSEFKYTSLMLILHQLCDFAFKY